MRASSSASNRKRECELSSSWRKAPWVCKYRWASESRCQRTEQTEMERNQPVRPPVSESARGFFLGGSILLNNKSFKASLEALDTLFDYGGRHLASIEKLDWARTRVDFAFLLVPALAPSPIALNLVAATMIPSSTSIPFCISNRIIL